MASTLVNAQQLSTTYGVSLASLRLYEGRGLLQPVLIDGARCYTPRDLVRLEIILKGKRLGFSLDEIGKLVLGVPTSPVATAERSKARARDLDRVTDELRTLLGRRDGADATIDELKTLLAKK